MRFKILHIVLLISCLNVYLIGQDLHFSYYQFTPLNVNPANAGAFSGSYRVSGIFSNKQAAITPRAFNTFTLSADAPIIRGIRKQDWIGVGVQADIIGSSGLHDDANNQGTAAKGSLQSLTFAKVGLAYHLSLDKKQTNILTFGVQYASGNKTYQTLSQLDGRVNPQTGLLDKDIDALAQIAKKDPNGEVGLGLRDWSSGILFNARRKNSDLKLGIALEGVFAPVVSYVQLTDSTENKYRGINFHGEYDMTINPRVHIIPGFYYYNLGPATAFNVNTHATYHLDPEKDLKLTAGLGTRSLRAIIFYAGAIIKDIKVGIAFDMDISTAVLGSNNVGGFELCASYMGKIYKKPKPKPVIFCPRL
ncbi:MAG TPA: PorP/SprF family type IX secretion system membrane protein [Saprospiraceae bacterium]|nr:PorP/SprF family type IX secretion system membrane protein [Saprospiraceae bacterium]